MSRTLIIGNGFDLQCGLKSTYHDFFNSELYEKFEEFTFIIEKNYSALPLEYNLDHIYFKNFNYGGIEQTRKRQFKTSDFDIPKFIHSLSFWDLLFFFDKRTLPNEWNSVEDRIKSILSDTTKNIKLFQEIQQNGFENMISATFFSFFPKDRWDKFDNSYDFLLNELNIFEKNFSEYISLQIQQNDDYFIKARSLAENLLQISNINMVGSKNILSFNYTEPFLKRALERSPSNTGLIFNYDNHSIINIHGTYESNEVIFGIDPKGITTNDAPYIFTKTYRQLVTNNISKYKPLRFDQNNNWLIFFGHSLSENDYSYFEAIFDNLDLYNSDTILIFKFSIYDVSIQKEIELDMVGKVTKLLEAYSSTLSNLDHRENLLSRLILERRILISSI